MADLIAAARGASGEPSPAEVADMRREFFSEERDDE